jgi:hypothetical protein
VTASREAGASPFSIDIEDSGSMAAEIVNLKQFRKKQARCEKDKQAEQNRISSGRTKSEKQLTTKLNEKAKKSLDQGRIEQPKVDE